MSYDIRICVKAEGCDAYPTIATPEHDNPTYNLGRMFRKCMDWDYNQTKYYQCDFVITRVEHGLKELKNNRDKYLQYNPDNGWGNIDDAISVLTSLRQCIYETAETVPIHCLYMHW